MNDKKWTIKQMCVRLNINMKELAEKSDIPYNHLKMVSAGAVRMTAEDLVKLHNFSGLAMEEIETEY